MNQLVPYYANQAGTGYSVFSGQRFQRGDGFFGKLMSGTLMPAIKWLGRQALSTGVDIADDVLDGNSLRESASKRIKDTGKKIGRTALNKSRSYLQQGSGRRRKRITLSKKYPKIIKKVLKKKKRKTKRRTKKSLKLTDFLA